MDNEEFLKRLEAYEPLFLSGSDRKIYLKKQHTGPLYVLSTWDGSGGFTATATVHYTLGVDNDLIFFYNRIGEGVLNLVFHIRCSKWEAGE